MFKESGTTLDHFEEDYITFNIEDTEGKFYERVFLLSINEGGSKKDFLITKRSLKEISRKFPGSVLYEYQRIKISKRVYSRIIGSHLKPMDTDCLESEF